MSIAVTRPKPMTSTASKNAVTALAVTGGVLAGLIGLGWVGLQVKPASFPTVQQPVAPETIPLPAGLPAPVERYYRQTYGEQVPIITSAAISGRGTMRPFGPTISFPIRFRFIHQAGGTFRAYFELTAFGLPLMKVNEHFVGGKFRQKGTPGGGIEGEPKEDHGANLRMWAEWAYWLPAALLTDPRVSWEPIGDATALLVVPSGEEQERLVVRFDPATGGVQYVEAMKYKHPTDTSKTLWINAVWFGDRPWAEFNIENIVYNADVDTSLTAKGP